MHGCGKMPARHTKVVDENQRPLKTGSHGCSGLKNDVTSSKPCSQGRDGTEEFQKGGACVVCCGNKRCKTCDHIFVGSSFTSNVNGRCYNVTCAGKNMNCGTKNIIYLISCRKCAVQYVGETSQTLRSRFNNHRNRLKQLCGLYLYHHFNSDSHTLEDISIMPIEEVVLEPGDSMTLPSKRLQREEFWYRELCSVYPYGLNDNVKGVGNVSSMSRSEDLIVYTLFNKHERKYRKRKPGRCRRKVAVNEVAEHVKCNVVKYKNINFTLNLRTYMLNLPRNKLRIVADVTESQVLNERIPARILSLVKDLIAFRFRSKVTTMRTNVVNNSKRQYMNVLYHNKGMDFLNLPRILNCKRVMMAVPNYLRSTPPPVVSYTYTRTIAGKIFNHRKVVEELDMDNGTDDIECSCSSSSYRYEPCGHIVTGDLSIIRDITVRNLIKKGPSYREQNNIDWKVNEKTSKEAVSRYCQKWAKAACVDKRVLRDWKETMYSCIDERIKMLQQLHLNKRKKQVLKSKVHLDYLNKLHDNFVLVPADKATNNVIVVCNKYYLNVVIMELGSTSTYKKVNSDCMSVINRHLDYMLKSGIDVYEQHETLPSFYWLPKLHKTPYGTRFIAASNRCTTKQLSALLTSCFKTIITHFKL